ncbi:hypothetical protein KEU06_28005 [Pseudaminobacter sp. 19-2017]|uniref:Uncharacterized protein n=1 Tax=Pseudaminobacter soli (ex Zhang et al. 2022) TaxID=2831468 RepID=A0A942EC44_9HYPH|nr:hypothetical protein [Pseudaminobacter soli]MBS3652437.1 hypothetical protein [Pseudaminobacter soli]
MRELTHEELVHVSGAGGCFSPPHKKFKDFCHEKEDDCHEKEDDGHKKGKRPGWGFGDKNHCHSGPPGLN